jgi:hypothetical protein
MNKAALCGKARYRDKVAAQLALLRLGRVEQRREKDAVRVYPCPKCKGWHLTSKGARR